MFSGKAGSNARLAKILVVAGFASIAAELFAVYYTAPLASNPVYADHPILDILGASGGMFSAICMLSAFITSAGVVLMDNRRLTLSAYSIASFLVAFGLALGIYGLMNPIVLHVHGTAYSSRYTLRAMYTVIIGFFLLILTTALATARRKESQKKNLAAGNH